MVGLKHLLNHKYFLPMMPSFLPNHKLLIYISGIIEVVLGLLLLFPECRYFASLGIISFLIVVFPANIHIAINNQARQKMNISSLVAFSRLFFQPVLIVIAYWHSY
tara:strand:- start:913 stop:1230 length:318 start_codon:yes stop_codon:yes gene_type:complete